MALQSQPSLFKLGLSKTSFFKPSLPCPQVTNRELTMVWQFAPDAAEVRGAQALLVKSMKVPQFVFVVCVGVCM